MSIPQVRARLIELADQYGIPELRDLAYQTLRRQPQSRAPRTQRRITQRTVDAVRAARYNHPDWSLQRIAEFVGWLNGGRVSEILHGYEDGSPFVPAPDQ